MVCQRRGDPNYGNANFQVTANKTSTLNYTLRDIPGETATISFVLTMPDGTERRADTTVTVEQRPLEFTGSLNILRAAVYPGKTLTITADIEGQNDLDRVQLPASWQMDGQDITGYSNENFTIINDAAHSQYHLTIPADAQPGTHTVGFRVGNADSTGVNQLVLTAEIEIVLPAQAEEEIVQSPEAAESGTPLHDPPPNDKKLPISGAFLLPKSRQRAQVALAKPHGKETGAAF